MCGVMREVSLLVFRTNFYKYTVSLRTCTDSLVGFGVNKASVLSSKLTGKDETVEKKKKQEEEKNQRNGIKYYLHCERNYLHSIDEEEVTDQTQHGDQ